MADAGELLKIWRKPARREPMLPLEAVELIEGEGLEASADTGGRRQVTITSLEAWRKMEMEMGRELRPEWRRANLLVKGIELDRSTGRVLQIGPCRIKIQGETRPCSRMDEALPGLRRAMEPEWRAGAWGVVLKGGRIQTGALVQWVDQPAPQKKD